MRKTMIAFAAAFAVCTATMTSGTTAAFARGGGSLAGALMALVEAALEATDLRWAGVYGRHFGGGFGHLGRGFRDRRFGRFGFGLYGYASGSYYNYGYGACSAPPPHGYAWACY